MDRAPEKSSSKRSREDRDRHHRHHRSSHRESSDSHHRDKSSRREEREGSRDRRREDRERSSEKEVRRERDYEEGEDSDREGSRRKRKDRGESEERGEKRTRVSEEKRERRRFGDKAKSDDNAANNTDYSDVRVSEGLSDEVNGRGTPNGNVSSKNDVNPESFTKTSNDVPATSMAPVHSLPTKVSSLSNTNENKGVSITRSHEVTGKSSTDGSSSTAGKSASLNLDVLAKAKKALQMRKELAEKIKKIPQLSKGANSRSGAIGAVHGSVLPANISGAVSAAAMPSLSSSAVGASSKPPASGVPTIPNLTNLPDYEAVKRAQELAAKMGFRQDPEFAPLINLFPGQLPVEITVPQKPTKAPVLRLDALGREIDEHGNVVNMAKPSNLSTLKVNINKQKKDAFQILKPELEVDPEANPHFDERMGINKNKLLRPKRMSFQFVEEGKWAKEAEMIKLRSQFGEERARDMKAKQALHAKAKAAPDINPNLIEVSERIITKEKPKDPIPEVEWWDLPLLPAGAYAEVNDGARQNLKMEKITIYVEHPRPIEPPAEPAPPPPQPLKLTKKEQKKLRTQRRLAREKDRQEMIRQGLIEPPKPKVKMSNLMKVLGSEATQDPTRLEKEIRTAAAEREQAHIDRNVARKLTPAERREKKERKLFDDTGSLETIVSVYKINDLSHKKNRFKVDVNAHENRLTGCGVITEGVTVVVVEGGSKSIKRYGKLMLRRINWAEVLDEEEDGDDEEEKPVNKCSLVWQGSVAKQSFHKFSMHECVTEAAARKIFADAGVGHYWDLAVNFSDDQ